MPHITTCTDCGRAYMESSEERANQPDSRQCPRCHKSPRVAGLTGAQWRELCQRVGQGMATDDDARPVEDLGMLPQAIRIRAGMATFQDSVLIHLQVQMRLLGLDDIEKSGTGINGVPA